MLTDGKMVWERTEKEEKEREMEAELFLDIACN